MSNNETCERHTKYDGSYWATDARGIPIARVCSKCYDAKVTKKYRPEVLNDSNYESDEPIEESY